MRIGRWQIAIAWLGIAFYPLAAFQVLSASQNKHNSPPVRGSRAVRLTFTPWEMTTAEGGKTVSLPSSNGPSMETVFQRIPRPDPRWRPAANPRTIGFDQWTDVPCNDGKAAFFFFRTTLTLPPGMKPGSVVCQVAQVDDAFRFIVNHRPVAVNSSGLFQVSLGSYLHAGLNAVELILADWCASAGLSGVRFVSRTPEDTLVFATLPNDPPALPVRLPRPEPLPKPHRVWNATLKGDAFVRVGPVGGDRLALIAVSTGRAPKTTLRVVHLETGKPAWTKEVPKVESAAADDERLYLLVSHDSSTELRVYDWRSGKLLRTAAASPGRVFAEEGVVAWPRSDKETAAADAATGRELWHHAGSLEALGSGKAFLFSPSEAGAKGFILLDPKSGRTLRKGIYNDSESSLYDLGQVAFFPESSEVFVQEGDFGAGVNHRELRAVRTDVKPIFNAGEDRIASRWVREGAWGFELLPRIVIAEEWSTYEPVGFAGLEPVSGLYLWRRSGGGELKRVWGKCAVALLSPRGGPAALVGIRLWDGLDAWRLPVENPTAFSVGGDDRWLIVAQYRGQETFSVQGFAESPSDPHRGQRAWEKLVEAEYHRLAQERAGPK